MDRNSFILELRKHLTGIPQSEMEDILTYYEEYFTEAGIENEEQVISELGSPRDVAMKVLGDYTLKNAESSEKPAKKWTKMIWVAILGIFAAPIALPIAIALVIVIIALLIAFGSILIGFFSVAISLFAGGILAIIGGFSLIISEPATSIFFIGFGCVSLGVGVLLSLGTFVFGRYSFKRISIFIAERFKRRASI